MWILQGIRNGREKVKELKSEGVKKKMKELRNEEMKE
jgi:hypothetical protein